MNPDDLPEPGEWVLNWACGDVASWYHGEKTADATYAHLFDCESGRYIEVDDRRLDLDDVDPKLMKAHVRKALTENAPVTS